MPGIDSNIVFLKTTDMETTTDFYGRIFNLPVVLDQGT
jgi:hypothetical protein